MHKNGSLIGSESNKSEKKQTAIAKKVEESRRKEVEQEEEGKPGVTAGGLLWQLTVGLASQGGHL